MTDFEKLKAQFDHAMFRIYQRAKDEANYPANIFLQMITDKGGLATAKVLINAPKESDGYTALWERGRLDLTVEAEVVENECWYTLFTADELKRAKNRLIKYRYKFKKEPNSN